MLKATSSLRLTAVFVGLLATAYPGRAQTVERPVWRPLRPGLEQAELEYRAGHGLLPVRVILVRADLKLFQLDLQPLTERGRAAWSIDHAPADAVLAVNAGQFTEAGPWGWVVAHGRLRQLPRHGPLVAAIAANDGGARWLEDADVAYRIQTGWRSAFQSYPVLLRNGNVPAALARTDRAHRDTRLVLALDGDTLTLALTRYAAAGRWLERLPVGLTVEETARLMAALGARHALMLDGGLSAQLLVRDSTGRTQMWRGLRRVPLGLLLTPRQVR